MKLSRFLAIILPIAVTATPASMSRLKVALAMGIGTDLGVHADVARTPEPQGGGGHPACSINATPRAWYELSGIMRSETFAVGSDFKSGGAYCSYFAQTGMSEVVPQRQK